MKKNLIEFIGDGQCHICGTVLEVYEKEMTRIELQPDGVPINTEVVKYLMYGKCPKCGTVYPNMEKNNLAFTVPNMHRKRMPSLQITKPETNPFGYSKGVK